MGFGVVLVINVVEPVGRIWDEEEEGPEAGELFTAIILGEEPVKKKGYLLICLSSSSVWKQNSLLSSQQFYC